MTLFQSIHFLSLCLASTQSSLMCLFRCYYWQQNHARFSVQLEACVVCGLCFFYNTLRFVARSPEKYRPHRHVLKAQTKFFQYVQSLLFILQFGHPEIITILADIGQDGTAHKDHVLSAGRILDANFEFLQLAI